MYRPTERSWEKFDDYRPLRYDSDAAGPREGVLLGANLGHATVTNGDFTAYVCDSAATRPSSQITGWAKKPDCFKSLELSYMLT